MSDSSLATTRLLDVASRVLPGGTFGNVGFHTMIERGLGGRVWDTDGREYVDYLLGSGPMLVGHCHPAVNAAVHAQVEKGATFFANNPQGIALAQAIVEAVPCAQQVRFVSTGTEADAYAMRLARAVRGRDRILKFEGGYHGMSDYGLMSLAPRRAVAYPQAVPDSAGIPASVQGEVLVAPFNDIDSAVGLIRAHHDSLGGVIVEPFQRLLAPVPGFLQALREETARHAIPLIFDEVVTGFRFSYGGAQQYYGVTPDLCTLGKACGGGFALAAIAGRADLMAHFDRAQVGDACLTQLGTLSGNPVASVAGLATLALLREPGAYERLFATGRTLMESLREQLALHGFKAQVIGAPPMFEVLFSDAPVRDYRDTRKGDAWLAQRLNTLLRERGLFKSDNKYYVSLAHTPDDIAFTQQAWRDALRQLAREHRQRNH